MKILITLALFLNFLFSLEITKNVTLNETMQSEFYKIYINLTQDAKSKNDIEINFEKAIEYAKDSEVCKGGKYNIYPRYSYHNGKRKFLGYNGSLAFNCTFKDEKIIEEFLSDIEKIDDLKISQGQMQPTL
ncbi:MAG TPA: hypothetical protein ENK66_05600, partial [Arcobacter sp.]|nr:hypothetical protein [Arcobacter sp.]